MNLTDLAGKYRGNVTWSDSLGESGSLTEVTVLRPEDGSLLVDYQDGSSLRLDQVDGVSGLYTVRRNEGEVCGRAVLTNRSLVLDYTAGLEGGPRENNTDVWRLDGSSITRTGLIRQPDRTIWFEADMVGIE